MTFEELLKLCIKEDRAALNELAQRYYSLVYSIVLKKIGKPSEVEDLVQEIFLSIIKTKAIAKFRGNSDKEFCGYLAKIALYTVSNNFKKYKLKEQDVISDNVNEEDYANLFADDSNPLNLIIDKEVKERLDTAISELKPEYRQVIKLRLLSYTNREVAEILKKPKATVDTWANRALKVLREKLKDLNVN